MLKISCNHIIVLNIINILWGMNFIMGKLALKYISPLLVVFIRIFLVSFLYILLYNIFGIPKYIKQNFKKIFLLAIVGIVGNQCCFMTGLKYTTPEHSAMSISFIPIFAHVIACFYKIEKPSIKTIFCLLIATVGFFIIHSNAGLPSKIFIGDIITLCGALLFAEYMVLVKVYDIPLTPFQISSLTYIFAVPIIFPLAIPFLNEMPLLLSKQVILPLLYIVIFASIIAYILHMWVIKKIGVTKVSLYTFTQPVWATIFSLMFFKEALTFHFIIGGILIIFSIILSEI
ncbi:MAG: DMT family transporter [Planctomycetota bacterium]